MDTIFVALEKSNSWINLKDLISSLLGFLVGAGLVLFQQFLQKRKEIIQSEKAKWGKLNVYLAYLQEQNRKIDIILNELKVGKKPMALSYPITKLLALSVETHLGLFEEFQETPNLIYSVIMVTPFLEEYNNCVDKMIDDDLIYAYINPSVPI